MTENAAGLDLNRTALAEVARAIRRSEELRIDVSLRADRADVLDFGVNAEGGLDAGVALARICLAGRGEVSIVPGQLAGQSWPFVQVTTDAPAQACLFSQYAGWQVQTGTFFGMGSGPLRAVAAREPLFEKLGVRESSDQGVLVLESAQLPDADVAVWLSERSGVPAGSLTLCVARTASLAGSVQIVARSVETAMHQLHERGFDVHAVRSGFGTAPLPPVAGDDLTGIARTNDAILCGATVHLWIRGDDALLADMARSIPSHASPQFGRPFLELFEEAGRDFYKLDPQLFSPARVVLHNLQTGRVHTSGTPLERLLLKSFGLPEA